MSAKLVWSPKARTDIRQIYVDIGREQPQAAERYFQRFRQKASLLMDQPRLGQRHPEIDPSTRMLVEAPYLILYATVPDADEGEIEVVEIVRVVDGRRDLKSIF
jgi:toxin ParE1/3/4